MLTVQNAAVPHKQAGSYPELAFEIPNSKFDDENFRSEIAEDIFSTPWSKWWRFGSRVELERTTKHFGPTSVSYGNNHYRSREWHRSHLWFYIRFTIQSSFGHSGLGAYKAFMLFFMCNLADYATSTNTHLSSTLLHSMTAKLLRRFRKLGSSVLSDAVSQTCTNIARVLDQRWQRVQAASFPPESSSSWDPSLLDLTNDVQSPSIHEHISTSFTKLDNDSPRISSLPSSQLRGALDDFLSNPDGFLSPIKGGDDIHVMLYDVERAIREDLDDWVARVTDIDKACEQLERLAHRYLSLAQGIYWDLSERHGRSHRPLPHPSPGLEAPHPFPSLWAPRGHFPPPPSETPPSLPLSRGSSPPLEISPRGRSRSPPSPISPSPPSRPSSPPLEIPLHPSPPFPRGRSPSSSLEILPCGRSRSPRLKISPHRRPICPPSHSLRSSSPSFATALPLLPWRSSLVATPPLLSWGRSLTATPLLLAWRPTILFLLLLPLLLSPLLPFLPPLRSSLPVAPPLHLSLQLLPRTHVILMNSCASPSPLIPVIVP